MLEPFCNRASAGCTGVAVPGVTAFEESEAAGASSDMQKIMVSARLCTLSIGFLVSKIFLLALASAMVTDIAVDEATAPPTGTSEQGQQGVEGRRMRYTLSDLRHFDMRNSNSSSEKIPTSFLMPRQLGSDNCSSSGSSSFFAQ